MKKRVLMVLPVSLLIASCQTAQSAETTSNPAISYSALATEPFWSLKIEGGDMRFERAGNAAIRSGPFDARPSFNGWRYLSKRMTADVTFAPCSDGMSDNTYKDTVTVMVDGEEYKGCGGGVLPPESLDDTSWTIGLLGSEALAAGIETEIHFADGKISGTAGCNRFSASYTHSGNVLSVGPVISTKMMCPEPQMAQERKFFDLLDSGKLTKRFSVSGDLVLTSETGGVMTLRRVN